MTDTGLGPSLVFARRLRLLLYGVPVGTVALAVPAGALEARSLLVAGAVLIGWSQLVGL